MARYQAHMSAISGMSDTQNPLSSNATGNLEVASNVILQYLPLLFLYQINPINIDILTFQMPLLAF